MNDEIKRNIVFVAGCVLCPMFQASNESFWNTDIINQLASNNVNIIALPCPETLFFGVKDAPLRGKHGFDYYSSNNEFVSHCKKLAMNTSDVIQKYIDAGYVISQSVREIEIKLVDAGHIVWKKEGTKWVVTEATKAQDLRKDGTQAHEDFEAIISALSLADGIGTISLGATITDFEKYGSEAGRWGKKYDDTLLAIQKEENSFLPSEKRLDELFADLNRYRQLMQNAISNKGNGVSAEEYMRQFQPQPQNIFINVAQNGKTIVETDKGKPPKVKSKTVPFSR